MARRSRQPRGDRHRRSRASGRARPGSRPGCRGSPLSSTQSADAPSRWTTIARSRATIWSSWSSVTWMACSIAVMERVFEPVGRIAALYAARIMSWASMLTAWVATCQPAFEPPGRLSRPDPPAPTRTGVPQPLSRVIFTPRVRSRPVTSPGRYATYQSPEMGPVRAWLIEGQVGVDPYREMLIGPRQIQQLVEPISGRSRARRSRSIPARRPRRGRCLGYLSIPIVRAGRRPSGSGRR